MKQVLDYLRDHRERFVRNLCDYLRFPSVSAQEQHQGDMMDCAEWLCAHCRSIGLETEVSPTDGHPIVLARTPRQPKSSKPHYLVYGHYDVQPPEPFELWDSPPFEPRIKAKALYGRGASDNKGQHLAHLNAAEAYLRTETELPVDLTFLIEGEEEVGSASLTAFIKANRSRLRCDAIVISDTGMPRKKLPALTYALRGVVAMEVKLVGPSRDLHSGIFGGSLANPATALCELIARLHDKRGRVAVPGFYDNVVALTRYERSQLARLPHNESAYRRFLGVPALWGEKGYTSWEQRTARPTLEINGLTSGYQGEGSKTIVPSWASAKLTCRLVPDQEPKRVVRTLRQRIEEICPSGVRLEIQAGHGAEPYLFSPTSEYAHAALRALESAFSTPPVLMREGGSIPIVTEFRKLLGADTLLLGLGLPDDNPHSPNEKFDLDNYHAGARLSALLWPELAAVGPE